MINQDRLGSLISRHKKILGGVALKYRGDERKIDEIPQEDKSIISALGSTGKQISLIIAEFKCQKCKSEANLTLHHLIMRYAKEYMGFWRYATQRYYWANMVVLCKKCHSKYHRIEKDDDALTIEKSTIDKLKYEYLVQDKDLELNENDELFENENTD